MRIENMRAIFRKEINKTIIEDDQQGLILTDSNLNVIKKLGFEGFKLLDFAPNGNIVVINSKKWLTKSNANKTTLVVFDINSKKQFFSTEKFLAYRSLIDKNSDYFLLEYYNGLCSLNIKTGEIIFRKDKIDKNLYNADLHFRSNVVYMPTKQKSLLTFSFSTHKLEEIKVEKTGGITWVKYNNSQSRLLLSDKKNSLHCFEHNYFTSPIWTINFSKFKTDNRIWCYKILTTESNIGCIQGFTPTDKQTGYAEGTLYIFNIENGQIIDSLSYATINEKIITDYETDKILIDNFTTLSLTTRAIGQTPIYNVLK